jgi:SagB-type dehydrogenase family enzyme
MYKIQPEKNSTIQNLDQLWEVFHENSKVSRYNPPLADSEVFATLKSWWESLPFEGYPKITLPHVHLPTNLSFEEILVRRATASALEPRRLSLEDISTLLHYSYGVTRDRTAEGFPRPFRIVPSAGALYPLEIFFYSAKENEIGSGIFHYSPAENALSLVRNGDYIKLISEAFVQEELILSASLLVFITAFFDRSIFKYGNRGYRFALIEAGHVAQNLNLLSTALNLGCVNMGGFYDRKIDNLLGLDGLNQSTLYAISIGGLLRNE